MKYLFDQIRLLFAEKLMFWAAMIAPRDHKDSVRIWRAVAYVASGEVS